MIGKSECVTSTYYLYRTYGSSSVSIHDHRSSKWAAFVRFGFSSDPGDARDLLSKKACRGGWIGVQGSKI